jgi:hypothetical protein
VGRAGGSVQVHAGVSSHFLNSLFSIGSGKLAAQLVEKEHNFGARRAKSSNFPPENVEISVIHDWPLSGMEAPVQKPISFPDLAVVFPRVAHFWQKFPNSPNDK